MTHVFTEGKASEITKYWNACPRKAALFSVLVRHVSTHFCPPTAAAGWLFNKWIQ